MTPRELAWEYAAAERRTRDQFDQSIVLAWQIERVRILSANNAQKKRAMPSLAELLRHGTTKQTPADMKKTLYLLSDQYGFPVKQTVH